MQAVKVKTEKGDAMKRKSVVCPKCKSSKNVIPIGYGLPAPPIKFLEDGIAEQGDVEFKVGGCEIGEAQHYCKACKHEW